MAENEKTSKRAAAVAGHVLSTGEATKRELMMIAAALLNQAPDKKPAKKSAPKRGGKR